MGNLKDYEVWFWPTDEKGSINGPRSKTIVSAVNTPQARQLVTAQYGNRVKIHTVTEIHNK